jgi:hypothetical protein
VYTEVTQEKHTNDQEQKKSEQKYNTPLEAAADAAAARACAGNLIAKAVDDDDDDDDDDEDDDDDDKVEEEDEDAGGKKASVCRSLRWSGEFARASSSAWTTWRHRHSERRTNIQQKKTVVVRRKTSAKTQYTCLGIQHGKQIANQWASNTPTTQMGKQYANNTMR